MFRRSDANAPVPLRCLGQEGAPLYHDISSKVDKGIVDVAIFQELANLIGDVSLCDASQGNLAFWGRELGVVLHYAGVPGFCNFKGVCYFCWLGNLGFAEVPEFCDGSHGNIEQSCGFLAVVPGKLQNLCGFGIDGHGFPLCVVQAPDITSFSGVTPKLFVAVAETHRIIESIFQQLP